MIKIYTLIEDYEGYDAEAVVLEVARKDLQKLLRSTTVPSGAMRWAQ